MSIICRPPVLRVGHQCSEIFFQGIIIQPFEFLLIIETFAHWVGLSVVLTQNIQVELVWPPVLIGRSGLGAGCGTVHDRASADVITHVRLLFILLK